ncbi:hypothetical protein CYMTET_47397 [Cymbomonas tetramitiformis]|uniref:Uncharacterized protein n=1 Tax=Cymbomonas tetramitiformis TaxID=36881 RepID=A0AAE0BW32_9CHLO|nr:hypothetical protein CYMTET_47397 [Cymbomonas tetramitiformis]
MPRHCHVDTTHGVCHVQHWIIVPKRSNIDSSTIRRVRSRKHVVAKKCLGGKEERFRGDESNATVLFVRLVPAIVQEAFIAEDGAFATIFTLEVDATVTVRAEANRLLYSTLELLVHPNSPASDWFDGSTASPSTRACMGGVHAHGDATHDLALDKFSTDITTAATIAPPPETVSPVDA